jgi:hypothetical protein
MSREQAVPDDEVLLAAGGWTDVPSARVLAKFATDDFCVAVLDFNGGLGGLVYETVEHFVRTPDGRWENTGDFGPAAGGGLGWSDGHTFLYAQSASSEVTVVFEGREHRVPTQTDGWFAFAARQDDYDEMSVPRHFS